ncbi:hypothetical protein ABIC09_004971 [Bradyrhizobium sp. S3.12.5]|uniref:hypothetical protein n=1 Tax=Bradyrhizobium sp. S3.12.5 TaxID=3156386 RepID=UPI003391C176
MATGTKISKSKLGVRDPAGDRLPSVKSGNSLGLERVRARQDPDQWGKSEMMSLAEAAALFFPSGLLTTASLRTAVRDGRLDVVEIAGKILTNKLAIERMCVCGPRALPTPSAPPRPPEPAAKAPSDRELVRRMLKGE